MRIRNVIAVLIIFVFLVSIAATVDFKKVGYDTGYNKGLTDGKEMGTYDCIKYGRHAVLRKVTSVDIPPGLLVEYKYVYKAGYSAGFNTGYQSTRYAGLRR